MSRNYYLNNEALNRGKIFLIVCCYTVPKVKIFRFNHEIEYLYLFRNIWSNLENNTKVHTAITYHVVLICGTMQTQSIQTINYFATFGSGEHSGDDTFFLHYELFCHRGV